MAGTVEDLLDLLIKTRDDLLRAIQDARINPNQIQLVALSDLSKVLGLVQAGEFRSGNGKHPGSGFTGTRMGWPPFDYDGAQWHLVGVNNDVLQFGLSATDGKAWAGGGAIQLTASGLSVVHNNVNTISAFTSDQTFNGESVSAGDLLIGDNSSGKANLYWDASAEQLQFRSGTKLQGFLSGAGLTQIGCRIRRATDQSIPDATPTAVHFSTVDYDDASFVSLGTDDTKITIPTNYGGRYEVSFYAYFAASLYNGAWAQAYVLVNGATACIADSDNYEPINYVVALNGITDVILSAGDYLQLIVNHGDAGNARLLQSLNTYRPAMWIKRIR